MTVDWTPEDLEVVEAALRNEVKLRRKQLAAAIQGTRTVRYPTDTHRTWRNVPVLLTGDLLSVTPYSCVPVAIEFVDGARSLVEHVHPERAYYLFGPEDGSLPRRLMERCRDVVRVPTRLCMNLAATVNVVLYDRMAKRGAA